MSVWSDSSMMDYMSHLDLPFLMADEDPCFHTDLEAGPVKPCLRPHQFGGNEESELSYQCPCIDSLGTCNVGDAFTGLDWMVQKVNFFDTSSDLLAVLDSSCGLLGELPFDPLSTKQVADLDLESVPNSPGGLDQLAHAVPDCIFPDDMEVEKVINVEEKPDLFLLPSSILQDSCTEIDEGPILDSDSGVGSSPPHSPVESLDRNVSERSPEAMSVLNDYSPARSKPYDRPGVQTVGNSPKFKSNCSELKSVEKKLKKMEQNKSAATRYRQKKRDEHGAISTECSLLEKKNKTLHEKADLLTKEIQYLKGLIEEVWKGKSKKSL
ncbi:cyclic AMP-dependent transcription factor ATF-4-like [Rhinoraja longicauda]